MSLLFFCALSTFPVGSTIYNAKLFMAHLEHQQAKVNVFTNEKKNVVCKRNTNLITNKKTIKARAFLALNRVEAKQRRKKKPNMKYVHNLLIRIKM